MIRRWPRRLATGLVGLAVLLAALVILLWLTRVQVLSWTATRLLERQGLGPASFTVDAAEFQGLSAHDVSLAGGAIKARSLTLAFSSRDLLAGHLVKLEIGGLDATLALGKNGIELAGRPLLAGGGGPSPFAGLSIDALGLEDAHLSLQAPRGRYEATLSATIAVAGGNLKASGIAATITAPVAGLSGPARIELTGSATLTGGRFDANGLATTITAPIAGLSAPLKAVVTADLTGTAGALEARNLSATVTAPVAGLSGPARIELTGSATLTEGRLDAKGLAATITAPIAGLSAPVKAVVTADLTGAEGALEARNLSATVTAPVTGLQKPAALTAKSVKLQPQGDGAVHILIAQATATPRDLPWTLQGVDGDFLWQARKTTGKFSIARLANLQKPVLVAPMKLSGSAQLAGTALDVTLAAETLTKTVAKLQAKGSHDLAKGSGNATIALAHVAFKQGGFQPGDLVAGLAGLAQDVDGSAGIAGTLRWTAKTLTPDLTLTLKDLALTTPDARIQAINGAIKLNGLWPPATPAGQSLSATIAAPGLPPAKLALTGQLQAKPALKLDRIAVDVAGGEITAGSFTLDPGAPDIATTLKVDHVDLAEITRLIGLEGLNGSGQLDGQIPVTYKAGKLAIRGGKLAARGPGTVSYKPSSLPQQLTEAGESVQLALQALSDFHYDKFGLDLDKAENGEGTVVLHLEGRNPAVMSGQVFNFNISLESNFDRLADIAMLSLRSAEDLLRRAARRGAP